MRTHYNQTSLQRTQLKVPNIFSSDFSTIFTSQRGQPLTKTNKAVPKCPFSEVPLQCVCFMFHKSSNKCELTPSLATVRVG